MPKRKLYALILVVVALILAASAVAKSGPSGDDNTAKPSPAKVTWPEIKFEKYKLQNGLVVILSEDHRLPLVAVNLWYHVGPVYEKQGRTGFAHLFEHMMFQGSQHVGEKAHIRYLEAAGASDINGTTDFDRTNYYETLPSNQLELALWLESDRMGFLLETLDGAKLANQRDVVRNERRENTENEPYQLPEEQLTQALYPAGHPYHGNVIGSHADIEAARLDDVREFFRQYYTPNNASLVIVGDFDPRTVRATVEKYFGPIPSGPAVPPVTATTPPITQEKRLVMNDKVELPRVYMAWVTAPIFKPGDAETGMMARVLGSSKSSRLYKKLVYEKQIAQDVHAEQYPLLLGSLFYLYATCKPGVKPEVVEQAINEELASLRKQAPSHQEMDRARNVIQSAKVEELERLQGVANRLNTYNHFTGNPGLLGWDLARYDMVTPNDLQDLVRTTLADNKRVVMYVVNGEKTINDVPKTAEEEKSSKVAALNIPGQDWRKTPPAPGPMSKLALPVPEQFTMSNGLTVLLTEQHNLPVVAARLVAVGGGGDNPADKPGLAGFTAAMLTEGTARRSALQVADDIDQAGATLTTGSTADEAFVATQALKRNADADFDIFADVILHPAFGEKDIERLRNQRLTSLLQLNDEPFELATRVGLRAIYGAKHPYGYPQLGSDASLKSISRADLEKFWSSDFTPGNAALVIAGDVSDTEARALANKYFGSWKAGGQRSKPPEFTADLQRTILLVDKPGSAQTAVAVATLGAPRSTPDYALLEVANAALGGLFSSRINMNLREKNGYTYGAFSWFGYHRGPGPFVIFTSLRTDTTSPAIREIFKEVDGIRAAPLSPQELTLAKDYNSRSLAGYFETTPKTVETTAGLFTYGLPVDYYRTLPAKIDAVTAGDVQRVANQYFVPGRMLVVAVGDRAKIEDGLKNLSLGKVELTNYEGEPVQAGGPGAQK
jgi:zinc protease